MPMAQLFFGTSCFQKSGLCGRSGCVLGHSLGSVARFGAWFWVRIASGRVFWRILVGLGDRPNTVQRSPWGRLARVRALTFVVLRSGAFLKRIFGCHGRAGAAKKIDVPASKTDFFYVR